MRLVTLSIIVALVLVVVIVVADLRLGPRRSPAEDDPTHWRLGVIYFNREDPRIFVPKRFGFGATVNFAKPVAWLVLVIPLAAVVFASTRR